MIIQRTACHVIVATKPVSRRNMASVKNILGGLT